MMNIKPPLDILDVNSSFLRPQAPPAGNTRVKDQMLSQRQEELSKGSKTNEDVKQEQIAATKDEIKKVQAALQKLQHEQGEIAKKQHGQLNLA